MIKFVTFFAHDAKFALSTTHIIISLLTIPHPRQELALDGNPFTAEASYKQIVIDQMQCLRQLDLKKITDDERRMASIVVRKEEEKKKECTKVGRGRGGSRNVARWVGGEDGRGRGMYQGGSGLRMQEKDETKSHAPETVS